MISARIVPSRITFLIAPCTTHVEMPNCQHAYASAPSPLADLALIAVLVVYAVSVILLFWDSPYILAILLLPAPAALVCRLGRSFVTVAAAGAILGPATEAACVAGGLWSYAETGGLPLIPPWLFIIWACFPTAMWLIVRAAIGRIPEARTGTMPLAIFGIALEIVVFVSIPDEMLLLFALALMLAAGVFAARPGRSTLVLMAAGSILGPVCEVLPVAAGAWHYARTDIWGMPVWLPLAYALFSVLVAQASLDCCSAGRNG